MKSVLFLVTGTLAGLSGATLMQDQEDKPEQDSVQIFAIEDLQSQRATGRGPWLEFLRSDDLYCGIYELEAGSHDGQRPHGDDEVYYVLSGKANFESDGKKSAIQQGSVIFVAKQADHRFVDIEEDISLLVFFANAPKKSESAADSADK